MNLPEARVFRPKDEKSNKVIELLMRIRAHQGDIPRPSWTSYASYLVNRDLQEVSRTIKQRRGG